VADREVCHAYEDLDAIRDFAASVDVLTFEFENVPAAAAAAAAERVLVRPAGRILEITQHRLREKTWLSGHGFPVTRFAAARSAAEVAAALATIGAPAILKTAGWGYDGKGQARIAGVGEAAAAWAALATDE